MQTPSSYPEFQKKLDSVFEKAKKLKDVYRNKFLMNLYVIDFNTKGRMSKDKQEQLKIVDEYMKLVGYPYHIHDKTMMMYSSKIDLLNHTKYLSELINTYNEFVSYLEEYEFAPEVLHYTSISLCLILHSTKNFDRKNEILEKLSSFSLMKFGEQSQKLIDRFSFRVIDLLKEKKFLKADEMLVPLLEIVQTIDNSEENIKNFTLLSFTAYAKANIKDNEEFRKLYKKVESIALKYPF